MKSSIVVLVVAVIVVIGAVGFIAVKDPQLLSLKSSSALPDTSPGMRVLATSEVNTSMTGGWYEVMNVTAGITNLSDFGSAVNSLSGSTSSGLPENASYVHLSYAQAVLFATMNDSNLAFGYAAFSSTNYANLTNSTVFSKISNDHLRNVTIGEVSGSFFIYGFNKTGENYSAAIYAVYSNYLILGFYHSLKNRTMAAFTGMVSTEISILNAYKLNFVQVEKLVGTSSVTSVLGTSFISDFNISVNIINPSLALNSAKNTSTFNSERSTYGPVFNITNNGTAVSGFALETFSSSSQNETFALGYLQAASSSVVSQAYMNITTLLNQSLKGNPDGLYIENQTYNGLKFFELNISGPNGPNITFAIGMKQNYLVFEADLGSGQMKSQLKTIMVEESNLL